MTSELLAGVAGIVASLVASYVPGVRGWFEALDGTQKRLAMLGVLLVVAGAAAVLSCAGVLTAVECNRGGLLTVVSSFVAALVANQSTYLVSPQKG